MSGVYLSWPFCPHKCSFCNFASGVFARTLESDYGSALAAEVSNHKWSWTPDTVYWGGGTPSLMEPALLKDVMSRIPGRPWREATLEALPGRIAREHVDAWIATGINRVSIGVQSFVPEELDQTGRRHTPEDVEADFQLLRECGIPNLCLDLIAGLPHQTADSWKYSLDWVERLQPDHVSVYILEVDEDSRLGREVLSGGARYGAPAVASEGLQVELYENAVERLERMGLPRYEISNFARPGRESIHNAKYWSREPYIGFGADAHSFDGAERWWNVESPSEYVDRWRQGMPARLESRPAIEGEERLFLGLRMMRGVEEREFAASDKLVAADRLVSQGLLQREGSRIRLSDRGVLLSNEVFQEFLS
jgi:oxygen-independent coproporphyrinogen III oxidase